MSTDNEGYDLHTKPKKGAPRMDARKYYSDDREDKDKEVDTDLSFSEKNASVIGEKVARALSNICFVIKS